MQRGAELVEVLEAGESLAIVCHDNPDPDCLASALALEVIARETDIDTVVIVYGGEISHQQNRAFVNMLQIGLRSIEDVNLEAYDCIAFVDHARPGENSVATDGLEPDVIVDHHPGDVPDAQFTDVRPDVGATATIFVEYLSELDVPLSTRLASALLFALHRERLDFVRDPTEREYEAALTVYPEADLESLEQLYGSAFTPTTIDAIGRAIDSRERRGSALFTSVGRTTETDALPQAADYLLNVEGVDTVLVYGLVGDQIRISSRSIDPRVHMGTTLRTAFGTLGSVGGHHDMAGGRIDLGLFGDAEDDDEHLLDLLDGRISRRFFEALNLDGTERQSRES